MLAHHARLHQSHQVQDRVDREVGVGHRVAAEELLCPEHLDEGGQLARQRLGEVLLLLLVPRLAAEDVDDGHDPVQVLGSLVQRVRQRGLHGVRGHEARPGGRVLQIRFK